MVLGRRASRLRARRPDPIMAAQREIKPLAIACRVIDPMTWCFHRCARLEKVRARAMTIAVGGAWGAALAKQARLGGKAGRSEIRYRFQAPSNRSAVVNNRALIKLRHLCWRILEQKARFRP